MPGLALLSASSPFAIAGKSGNSSNDPEGTSGPIELKGDGNPLQSRNIRRQAGGTACLRKTGPIPLVTVFDLVA
jgi:hypothetical protein